MEKQTYYVSVHENSILQDKQASSFEFEIQATEQELAKLQQLFEEKDDAELLTFRRSFIPGVPYHDDPQNDLYDEGMKAVYKMVYDLGNERTRTHIEKMGVL